MLFFAEMWERFSYYGMRALLIFYLTQHWLFNDSKSNLIYGAYTSLVYITPVLGGYIADRYLGQRKAVLFGGILLAAGHSLMAVEGVGGQSDPTINVFWAALAGIGMLAGLAVFVLGKKALRGAGEAPQALAKSKEFTLYGVGVGAVAVIWALVQYQDVIQSLLVVSGLALLGYVLYESFKLEKEPRERMFAILFLIALNPLFWGLFEQAGGSMNLFTDRYVDRSGVPASIFQSINPIYIILLAPLFAGLWQWLGRRGKEASAPAKFGLALAQMGLANLVLVWGAEAYGIAAMTPVIFIFLYYLFATTGELCLSPVGLSAMNRLAPSFLASLIMGAWFYMTAVGNFVAGKIGEATGGHGGEMSKDKLLDIYAMFGWISIGAAVAVLLLSPLVKRWMHLDTLQDRDPLAGRDELAEPQAPGVHPEDETTPRPAGL